MLIECDKLIGVALDNTTLTTLADDSGLRTWICTVIILTSLHSIYDVAVTCVERLVPQQQRAGATMCVFGGKRAWL